jgi:hypothetical protein
MSVKFKIGLYGSDKRKLELQKFHYAAQEAGAVSELIDLESMYNELYEYSNETACVYLDGPIQCTLQVPHKRPNWVPGSWHDPEQYRCMTYYAHWGKYITQQGSIFLPLGEVYRRRDELFASFGNNDGHIFLRPDYGEKKFNGQLVAVENFKDFWIYENLDTADPRTICVVSTPRKIFREFRLTIHDRKVAAGSMYGLRRNFLTEPLDELDIRMKLIDYAEQVASDNPPPLPSCYVMDIAEDDDGNLSLLEIGCIAAAGFYASDMVAIAKAIVQAAEKEYQERQTNES